MTERRSSGPWVVAAAGAVFAVVLIFLALQMRSGGDPALGTGTPVAAAPPSPRPVLIRKVIVRRVVEEARDAPVPAGGEDAGTIPLAAAPARFTPAPAPAPVAAPAPAPVTTGAS